MCALVDKGVKVISLNAFRTLIKPREHSAMVYSKFARELGFDVEPSYFEGKFYNSFGEMRKKDPCYGFNNGGTLCWWTQLMRMCFSDIITDRRLITKLTVNTFDFYATRDAWSLRNNEVVNDLDGLKNKNRYVAVISNSDFRLRNILSELGVLPRLEYMALSGEIGLEKPNPAIFNTLLKRFRINNRAEILHIGKDMENDVNAAKKFGASACLFEDEEKGKEEGKEKCESIHQLSQLQLDT